MDFLIFANTTINTQSYLIHMKRFILPLLIIILILTSLPTKANNEIESLLKTLDKSLQHKSVYTKQKQRQIDSLKIVLRQSGFFVKFGGTSSIVNKESWLSVVYFLPYCTSAFLPL